MSVIISLCRTSVILLNFSVPLSTKKQKCFQKKLIFTTSIAGSCSLLIYINVQLYTQNENFVHLNQYDLNHIISSKSVCDFFVPYKSQVQHIIRYEKSISVSIYHKNERMCYRIMFTDRKGLMSCHISRPTCSYKQQLS